MWALNPRRSRLASLRRWRSQRLEQSSNQVVCGHTGCRPFLTSYCRYIKQTVLICDLLCTPPQIGNGLRWRWLGFALARAPLRLGRDPWLYDSARRALRLLPLVNLGWACHHSGATSARPLGLKRSCDKTDPFDARWTRRWNVLWPGLSSGSGSLALLLLLELIRKKVCPPMS